METMTSATAASRPDAWRELNDLADDTLVDRVRERDLAAFEALMRRHNRRLFRVTRGVLRDSDRAQDAVQSAYLQAFTRLDTYQAAGKFPAWLTRIALDEALRMRQLSSSESTLADRVSDAPSADQFVEAAHARALLEHAVDGLPENFRMVFVLRAVEGLDVRETSESLGINPNTVRTRLFRATRLLRGELARRLRAESAEVFDFGVERCDAVVTAVLASVATRPA